MRTKLFACIALIILGAAAVVYSGTTGIISGVVTDSATGEKLEGVNVIVEGTDLTTVTDANGYYVITNVPPGDYRVTTSLVGYSDSEVRKISVLMDVTASVDVGLTQGVAQEESVVVTESRPMIQRDIVPTMYVVDDKQEKMVKSQPNLLYQAPGLVMTQPGVVPDEGGYPHIRGGRANQIGYLMDGIPITEPVTNGFGTNIATVGLDKMEIYAGGYRPEYGNATSGIFNQIVKTGKTSPGVSLEMLSGAQAFSGVHPEIGGVTSNGGDYYVSSYMWRSELEGMDYNQADSEDTIGKFNYPIGGKDKLTFLYGTGSAKYQWPYIHAQTFGPDGLQDIDPERDHTHQSYLLNALTLNHTISASSFFTVRPYYFRNRWKLDAVSNPDEIGYWWDAESATTGLQLDYTNQISPKHLLKAGTTRMASNNRYWATVPYYQQLFELPEYNYTANTDSIQTGLYLQDQMRLSPKWGAEVGLRYDRMKYDKEVNQDTSESQTSPRLGLSYALDHRSNLRFSYGKMIQFAPTQSMERDYTDSFWADFYGLADADLRPERCTQYDLGWERQVNDNYSVQVTPFYRKFTDMLQVEMPDPDLPYYEYKNLGNGSSSGLELLLKKRMSNNWSGWFAYTYQKARAQASNDSEEVMPGVYHWVDWDQRHTAVAVLNFARNDWNYSLMGQYGSGLPHNLDDGDPDTNLPGEETNSIRSPSYTMFNLNISREVKGGWLPSGTMSFSIANLFNSHTVLDRDTDGEPTSHIAPRFVSMSYTRRF